MDIVKRLRKYNETPFNYIAHEAAAKIEHLRLEWDTTSVKWGVTSAECNKLIIEIERLRVALKELLNVVPNFPPEGNVLIGMEDRYKKALIEAHAALKEKE